MPKKPYPSQIAPKPKQMPKRIGDGSKIPKPAEIPNRMGPDKGKVIKPYKGPRATSGGPSSTGPKKQVPSSTRKQPVYEFKNGRFSKATTPKMMGPAKPLMKPAKEVAMGIMGSTEVQAKARQQKALDDMRKRGMLRKKQG